MGLPVLLALLAVVPHVRCRRDVGILYEVWHTEASTLMREVQKKNGTLLTTELVIQSNGTLDLNDVYVKYGLNGDIWNVQPQLGFYCLYRRRANDTHPPVPDCPNINRTLSQHAAWMVEAGIDYIAIDVTNWPQVNQPTDIAVLRPTEVLFEEWLALRQRGIPTPQIAVWPCSPSGSTTWQYLVDNLYNNPKYAELVYRREGKMVVFLPAHPGCYDAGVAKLIQSNGGRNDITTIQMWALFGPPYFKQGWWGFFSPCTTGDSGAFTTSIVGESACNQGTTTDPVTGQVEEVSASGAYMVSQSALPFANPGHLRGLTLQKLFQKVLSVGAPSLFLSSFNEHIGGRQKAASSSNIAFNMGLPNDSQRDSVWVDTYAAEFSRDIEPTVEEGNRIWQVAKSCIQLYKQGRTCSDNSTAACCTVKDKTIWTNVWSMEAPAGADYLLTTSENERHVLEQRGWSEWCTPIGGPSVFCVDTSLKDGRAGPFMLYNSGDVGWSTAGTVPLYRCITSTGQHFFSTDPACEGQKTEYLLGYMSARRGRETLRALRRCLGPKSGTHLHALDLTCDNHDTGILGFVR